MVLSPFLVVVLIAVTSIVTAFIMRTSFRSRVRRSYTEPLNQIAEVTTAIADGAVKGRIELTSAASSETLSVASAINRLAGRAVKDIDEMHRLERVRSEFIANVSHELRTPIFSVQGYLETLLDGAIDDQEVAKQFLEKAYNNALRLNTLLNDLIEISRIESGELRFSFRYFDLSELLREIIQTLEIRAHQRSVSVHLDVTSVGEVYGDRERLSQVVTNLIDNAIKYNVQSGNIYVVACNTDGGVEVSIRDTGIGIPEEALPRIFERFYRVDKDRSRAVGGTGLGLAIVKHILEAHQAPISVQSINGEGTTISFVLRSTAS